MPSGPLSDDTASTLAQSLRVGVSVLAKIRIEERVKENGSVQVRMKKRVPIRGECGGRNGLARSASPEIHGGLARWLRAEKGRYLCHVFREPPLHRVKRG